MAENTAVQKKKLEEMSLAELWQLFPIFLVEHREEWGLWYGEMAETLRKAFDGCGDIRISHIGSTAIRGIWAKNIVDILLETDGDTDGAARRAESVGFRRMGREGTRVSLNLGYTEDGFAEKVYHLHIRTRGDNDELYFRDYLNEHPQTAKAYETLKLELWKRFEHDRDGYTAAKTEFIREWTEKAKQAYGKRY